MSRKGDYGEVQLEGVTTLFKSPVGKDSVSSNYPLTFEQLDQKFGFVNYETQITTPSMDPSVLQVTLRDRGIVYLDHVSFKKAHC